MPLDALCDLLLSLRLSVRLGDEQNYLCRQLIGEQPGVVIDEQPLLPSCPR